MPIDFGNLFDALQELRARRALPRTPSRNRSDKPKARKRDSGCCGPAAL